MDTIVAAATAPTKGAVGVIKLSGEDALLLARQIFTPKNPVDSYEARRMYLGAVRAGTVADTALLVCFKAPFSYTGEDAAELQTHGGPAVLHAVICELVSLGARPADPGEFTKRAFLNGKLSLDEAEGAADIVNAGSAAAANGAYRLLSGELSKAVYANTDLLLAAASNADAVLDYPDELAEELKQPTLDILNTVIGSLNSLLITSKYRDVIDNGVSVTIAGRPNAGKSSLLNAILGADRAIVTEVAGTTRDTLSESVEIGGIRYRFTDTAGIRKSGDAVETLGIERAKKAAEGADLVLYLIDLTDGAEDAELKRLVSGKSVIVVGTKSDIKRHSAVCDIEICCHNKDDIKRLTDMICAKIGYTDGEAAVLTKERHIFAVRAAAEAVGDAIRAIETSTFDRISADIKEACRCLARITGADVAEDVVDGIFARFCVGK